MLLQKRSNRWLQRIILAVKCLIKCLICLKEMDLKIKMIFRVTEKEAKALKEIEGECF